MWRIRHICVDLMTMLNELKNSPLTKEVRDTYVDQLDSVITEFELLTPYRLCQMFTESDPEAVRQLLLLIDEAKDYIDQYYKEKYDKPN